MYLHSPKLFVIIVFLSLIILPFVAPVSFNFSSFSPDDHRIKYEGSASPENNTIQLTRDLNEIARATYAEPIQLWDHSTRNMANFSTQFSFVIDIENRTYYADGLVFFLPQNGFRIPEGTTRGRSLGLTADNEAQNSTYNPFVAAESGIFPNGWELRQDHKGIDINSLQSLNDITWLSGILNGRQNYTWTFSSNSENLRAVFTSSASDNTSLYYSVRLPKNSAEWAAVGISDSFNSLSPSLPPRHLEPIDLRATRETNKEKAKLWVKLGPILAGGVFLVVLLSILSCPWRNQRQNNSQNNPDELEGGVPGPKKLPYKELKLATNNFAERNWLGHGSFGSVYRGYLRKLNLDFATKKKSRDSPQGMKEYLSEVTTNTGLRNRYLVRLIGWCHKRKGHLFWSHNEEQLLLVYEFMPNGSLYSRLYDNNTLLTWATRYRIAKNLASALLYLQEEWESNRYVVHRDIKSANVLLDSYFNAKLGDFGLARVVIRGQCVQTTTGAGTIEYMSPECLYGGVASKESDVFSFGIVALEIATGVKPNGHQSPANPRSLVNCVGENYRMQNLMRSADRRLGANFDEQEMKRLLIVGLWCANPDDCRRPSIREVVHTLNSNNEDSLPELSLQISDPPVNNRASPMSSAPFVTASGSW